MMIGTRDELGKVTHGIDKRRMQIEEWRVLERLGVGLPLPFFYTLLL